MKYRQEDPEHPVGVFEAGALDASLQDQDLLAKDGILNREPVSVRGNRHEQSDQMANGIHLPSLPGSGC